MSSRVICCLAKKCFIVHQCCVLYLTSKQQGTFLILCWGKKTAFYFANQSRRATIYYGAIYLLTILQKKWGIKIFL